MNSYKIFTITITTIVAIHIAILWPLSSSSIFFLPSNHILIITMQKAIAEKSNTLITPSFNTNKVLEDLILLENIQDTGQRLLDINNDWSIKEEQEKSSLDNTTMARGIKYTDNKATIVTRNTDSAEQHVIDKKNELTINDVRQSRLVLLHGINNAIERLKESQPPPTSGVERFNFNTTDIAQLLESDQLEEAIVKLYNLQGEVVKTFGQEAANKQVVPQIQNLVTALGKQKALPQ
jgi:hypothetical protein